MVIKKLISSILILSVLLGYLTPTIAVYCKDSWQGKIIVKFEDSSIHYASNLQEAVNKYYGISCFEEFSQIDTSMYTYKLRTGVDAKKVVTFINTLSYVSFSQEDYPISVSYNYQDKHNYTPQDSLYVYQWGVNNFGQLIAQYGIEGVDINVSDCWKYTKGLPIVVVGILDTGIDIEHEDLADSIYCNWLEVPQNGIDDDRNGYVDDVHGWDFLNNDSTVYDSLLEDIHGTYVAGIVGAQHNEVGIVGISPNVRIIPLKFMDGKHGNTSDAIRAINYAKRMGVTIINCSWSGTEYNEALRFTMKNSNIMFVCSAGNSAMDVNQTPVYPASFSTSLSNVISVGSIDNRGGYDPISNYGQAIDVVAPGVNVISTIPQNGYIFGGGTSAAAPHVTGIICLMKSLNPFIQPKEIKNILKQNVVKDKQYVGKVSSGGRVDAYKSIYSMFFKKIGNGW